ncbi:hypothetical protein Javan384_0009 [Streptococcus phage Javan384]|nr:hypothetical protein Javan384_0009 [Streptococcus phage Javan384]
MADYTLGVEVTGDASKMEKELIKAQKAVEALKKKLKKQIKQLRELSVKCQKA